MYVYANERHKLFTEEGLNLFVTYRDAALQLINTAGAFKSDSISLKDLPGISCVDTWQLLACADLLVERGELTEAATGVFVRGPRFPGVCS